MDSHVVVILLAAVPIGCAWEAWQRKLDVKREFRRNCRHDWGEIRSFSAGYYYRHCRRCGEQLNCDAEGKPWKREQI